MHDMASLTNVKTEARGNARARKTDIGVCKSLSVGLVKYSISLPKLDNFLPFGTAGFTLRNRKGSAVDKEIVQQLLEIHGQDRASTFIPSRY